MITKPSTGTVYQEFPVMTFAGLNNRDTSIHIDNNQSPDLLNVHFDNRQEITKRNGFTLSATTMPFYADPIHSLFPYYKTDGTKRLIGVGKNNVFDLTGDKSHDMTWDDTNNQTWDYVSGFYTTWDDLPQISYSLVKHSLQGSDRICAAVYKDTLYMLNGNTTDGLMKWDGTTFSTVASVPNGKYVVVHKNRMYIAGDPANPSRLYMSDLGTPESFPSLNFIDINTNDGDAITSIAEHLDSLVIFKERSIHVLRGTGPQNYSVLDSHQAHGTVSHWSVVQILNKLFYLARDGVYAFDGRSIHLESDVIRGSVLGLNNNQAWNQQHLSQACASEYKGKYYLSVPEGSSQASNNRVYVFDPIHNSWTRYDLQVNCFTIFQVDYANQLYSGDVANGNVYLQDNGTSDNGQPINAYYRTKDFDFGANAHFKSYKGLFFAAEQQLNAYSINIQYIQDLGKLSKNVPLNLGANTSQWGTMTWSVDPWGARPNVAKGTTAVAGASRYLAFKVSDNSTNPWAYLGWTIRYQVKRRLT